MDWFLILLGATTALRGLGAGIICGVELITLPARKRLGLIPYARFARALYRESGVKVYAVITILGALLTLVAAVWTFMRGEPAIVSWSIAFSLVATVLGLVGTAGAFPTMRRLWESPDEDEVLLSMLLDRFARWGTVSAVWHTIGFIALIVALTN